MFFTRLAAKANLVSSVIEQVHDIGQALTSAVPESLVGVCESRSRLARFAALASRFTTFLRCCPPDAFIKMGGVYQELSAAEKRLDFFVDALRREELKEAEAGKEMEK